MLRPFAHAVACCCMVLRVVARSLKPVKHLAPCKRTQYCWPTTPNIVGSCCARLHVALEVLCGSWEFGINLMSHLFIS